MHDAERIVQAQLDAYNARDLDRFIACYADTVKVLRFPSQQLVIDGKAALAEHYAENRFNRPALNAELISRMGLGNTVIDREVVSGVGDATIDAIAIYQVVDGLIQTVWFVDAK